MAATQTSGSLHPDLQSLQEQFHAITEDAGRLVEGLAQDQFNWRPSPERWSIAQCLAHLNTVDRLDVDMMREAIDRAHREGVVSPGPYSYGKLSAFFISRLEPPASIRTKAPKIYIPPASQDPEVTMSEFRGLHASLHDLLIASNGLDLGRVKVPTPVARFIKFSLGQRFRLIAAHDRRHLFQAWEVRRALP